MPHTPGPCRWCKLNGNPVLIGRHSNPQMITLIIESPSPHENPEDARLIAAAPDLLHACKLAIAFGSQGDTHEGESVSEYLRAAVAKAESV